MNIKAKRHLQLILFLFGINNTSILAASAEHEHSAQVDSHGDAANDHQHEETHKHGTHENALEHEINTVVLNKAQRLLAGIEVADIYPKEFHLSYYAPAEVKANGYTSYIVSPRTESVVVSRHVILGEKVKKGQKLVTLFSHDMAQAQANYLLAKSDWERVEKLANNAISESERVAVKTKYSAAYGQLVALGLSDFAIKSLQSSASDTLGQYSLVAQQAGIVLKDEFSQGQRISAGSALMLLADETTLWVEAKLSVEAELEPKNIATALVSFKNYEYVAKVIQQTHTIDTKTRTKIIRLSVENKDDVLHAGMFVDVNFIVPSAQKAMLVPESAVMRNEEQNWVVFVEQPDASFLPTEIRLGSQINEERIVFGLPSGSRIAVKGAFFIASEFAKSGFDPHNH
ncbi:efflux RND transporter periplasmic adaptor subunit [Pseudoalteromonas obscura]|uniref:Efflux RND transporter periplasmic adaptor subunit n=1 Tax=Pseudoalteromonas obscura TaxID=3048491 RepID=A0ABT7EGW8_9GAMM|nr:efflux RND transporter periplasmic adaptor subunit [Pseudoalteromonas sp. P94(2023)]MDK2594292.1 efflux RND transporter periplasmic adaptor subunit [Pseudoalteromonas sp. P94(2023)]